MTGEGGEWRVKSGCEERERDNEHKKVRAEMGTMQRC